jgi:high-affinity nickel-transport protein
MYPIGVLFSLGFDTSSEVALLGISAIQAAKGTSIWVILIFPLLFTAGMCLLDTTDGALMMALYTRAVAARDPIIVLYYSIILTEVTVVVALIIGILQLLSLISNVANPQGKFWDGVNNAGDHYDIIGKDSSSFLFIHTKSIRRCYLWVFRGVWPFECGSIQAMETVYRAQSG